MKPYPFTVNERNVLQQNLKHLIFKAFCGFNTFCTF